LIRKRLAKGAVAVGAEGLDVREEKLGVSRDERVADGVETDRGSILHGVNTASEEAARMIISGHGENRTETRGGSGVRRKSRGAYTR
jgi:hypothetical protein